MMDAFKRKQKVRRLFPDLSDALREMLRFDDVALYSVTDQRTADAFSKAILKFVPASSTLVNATACVGGNTQSFARHFTKVLAIEKDRLRYLHLRHNMSVMQLSNVQCVHGDCLDLLGITQSRSASTFLNIQKSEPEDIVFIDPPWGGPRYRDNGKQQLTLHLSGMELSVLVKALSLQRITRFVALKLPTNFDINAFQKGCGDAVQLVHWQQFPKMNLMILKCADSQNTIIHPRGLLLQNTAHCSESPGSS